MSDEVSDFLRSVELLKERREEEDEARSRELEEKILQEKKERQARRAERARSISPQKSSPANTPSPTGHRIGILSSASGGTSLASPGFDDSGSPRQRAVAPSDSMNTTTDFSNSPTKENDSPFDSDIKRTSMTITSPSIGMPSARSPLSWQRRPTSQSSDRPKGRPLSVVAAENAARNSPSAAEPAADQAMSRDQIAQSLASKDPSWFRQTADPGRGAGAFRKSQVEDQETVEMPSTRTQLPGMSRESAADPSKEKPASRPVTPTTTPGKVGSPLPLTGAQRLDPPAGDSAGDVDITSVHRHSVSSPTGRTSPTRPVSPTKGMGGFVQSAMMKRSDSVKRWSVNSPTGLQRADPNRANIGSFESSQPNATPKVRSRSKSMLRESSEPSAPLPPSSSEKEAAKGEGEAALEPKSKHGEEAGKTTPPTSPSKTMDPRRWSPTKNSSWLEAALNKPESPKAKPTPAAPNQPAWMVELNKIKAQKTGGANNDMSHSPTFPRKHEVKTGGLMRSTPMGVTLKPSALAGSFPAVPPSPAGEKPSIAGLRNNLRKASPTSEGPGANPSADAATAANAKPETPPKKDFRANLKPRAPPTEAKTTESIDELKTVFGSLRRTKTQNYVAPDELKDNILRGKAALNATGGPQKTERKDEFMEAILKKKEDFKKAQEEGRGITREPSSAGETQIPEGIAKRQEMARRGTISRQTPTTGELPPLSPALTGPNRLGHVSASSRHDVPQLSSESAAKPAPESGKEPASNSVAAAARSRAQSKVGSLAERFNPALAGLIARGPPPASTAPKGSGGSAAASGSSPTEAGEPTKPGPQLTHMTKNRARGPRRKAPTSLMKPAEEPKGEAEKDATLSESGQPAVSAKPDKPTTSPKPEKFAFSKPETSLVSELRKTLAQEGPKSESSSVTDFRKSLGQEKSKPESPSDFRKSLTQEKPKPLGDVISLVDSSKRMPKDEPTTVGQPITMIGSSPVRTRSRSPTKVHEQVAALAALSQQLPKPEASGDAASQPSSPKKLDMKRMSRFLDEQAQQSPKPEPVKSRPSSPVKDRFTGFGSPTVGKPVETESVGLKPALPVKSVDSILPQPASMPKSAAEPIQTEQPPEIPPKANRPLPLRSGNPLGSTGLGLVQPAAAPKPAAEEPVEAERPPQLPPKGARPLPTTPAVTSPRIPSPARSPGKQAAEVSALIDQFFGPERPRRKYTVDAAEILMKRPASTATVQTRHAQLIQLSPEGKKIPVPTHYERVLFEREMYICPHTYVDAAGKKITQVYFWVGDEVPESQADDAHLFAAREARALGGKLVKLVQGKETSEFLQALGGIVIIRRGSSNKYDSLAPNMLCGRRYLGQIAFDEVDFSPLSLCSGFPYLITQQGKCYLWKGKGSDVEELSCARLVGMDLALMGELLEADEGSEPDSFWDIFGGGTRPNSADHWRLKPNYNKYTGRLFCANATDKQQITELSPFKQTDLLPSNIYVLDAFFELYIIVGARSQHQYAAFRNALDFAQEYAILAAGMEDRPFVPISTVVLEGIPRDLKSVFRKWRDADSPTIMHPPSSSSSSSSSQQQQQQQGQQQGQQGQGQGQEGAGVSSGGGQQKGAASGLRRGRSLRVVPLTQALQALAE
ncbi:hypothetical protein VTK26DRAFT_2248 [Humicola hyalothermophila]